MKKIITNIGKVIAVAVILMALSITDCPTCGQIWGHADGCSLHECHAEEVKEAEDIEEVEEVECEEEICEDCTEPAEYLGEFTTYAYCGCEKCCTIPGNATASGVMPEEGVTIAADPEVIPLGSHIMLMWDDGNCMREYIVQDTGSGIKGYTLDIYMESHESALCFGVQKMQVYLLED